MQSLLLLDGVRQTGDARVQYLGVGEHGDGQHPAHHAELEDKVARGGGGGVLWVMTGGVDGPAAVGRPVGRQGRVFSELPLRQHGQAVEHNGADDGESQHAQDALHEAELLELEAG